MIKRLAVIFVFIVLVSGLVFAPNAAAKAQTNFALVGTEAALDLALANEAVSTIQLTADISVSAEKVVGRTVTLNLSDFTLSRTAVQKEDSVLTLRGGALTVTGGGSGKIVCTDTSGALGAAIKLDAPTEGSSFAPSTLQYYGGTLVGGRYSLLLKAHEGNQAFMYGGTIAGGMDAVRVFGNQNGSSPINTQFTLIEGTVGSLDTWYGLTVMGFGAKAIVQGGQVLAKGFGLAGQGNAENAGTTIEISGGKVNSSAVGVYHPQNGILTITGGEITGLEGVEIKAGTLNMSGGTIAGTDSTRYDNPITGSSGGSLERGNGILIDSRKEYSGAIQVNISGGTIRSTANEAVREVNTDGLGYKSTSILSGGSFSGQPTALYLLATGSLVTGGTFSSLPAPLAAGYTAYPDAAGLFTVAQACTDRCFVSPTGNDANPGTETLPIASIGKALEVVTPEGTVELLDGSFTGPVEISKPVTLKNTSADLKMDMAAIEVAATKTEGAWYPDRYPPAVFEGVPDFGGRAVIRHGVRTADGETLRPDPYKGGFYNTQGRKFEIGLNGANQSTSIELYLDPAWKDNPSQTAGVWGVGLDAKDAVSAYPIVVWRNLPGETPGFYYFDYMSLKGSYILLRPASDTDYGNWHELKFTLRVGLGTEYFIDGVALGKTADPDTTRLQETILNVYNFGSDYDVYWAGLKTAGSGPAKILGQVMISADGVTLQGLDISKSGNYGVITTKPVNKLSLLGNSIYDIGNVGGNIKGIYDSYGSDNVVIDGNSIRNLNATNRSADAINFGDSNTADPARNVTITNNLITNIQAIKGAYGIKLNSGAGVENALIQNNIINSLQGEWTHAVGLENKTPGAKVLGNIFSKLSSSGVDSVAVFFEANPDAAAVEVAGNQFAPGFLGIASHHNYSPWPILDGRNNYWGAATGPVMGQYAGDVLVSPWCANPECTEFGRFPVSMDGSLRAYASIEEMMPFANDGDVIRVNAPITVGNPVVFSKAVKLACDTDVKLSVTTLAAGYSTANFTMQAEGSSIEGCIIEKTDKTGIDGIIRIAASGVKILNNKISGQWQIGDEEVNRAMVVNAGAFSGLEISGNRIHNLRQPGYVSGTHSGVINNNYVDQTKGWVLEGGNLSFSGNTWGTNVGDIAILKQVPTEYYTDILAMSAENNNAVIEDQRLDPRLMSRVYVDANAPEPGNGTLATPFQSLKAGVDKLIAGGELIAKPGLYAEAISIVRPGSFVCGPNRDVNPVEGGRPGGECTIQDTYAVNISAADVALNGFEITGFTHAVSAQAAVNGLELSYNWIHQNSGGLYGLVLGIGRPAGAEQPPVVADIRVSHNLISGANKAGVGLSGGDYDGANGIDARYQNLEISNNIFKNGTGCQVFAGAGPSDYQIDGFRMNRNVFDGNGCAFNLGNIRPSETLPAEMLDNVFKGSGGTLGMQAGTIAGNTFTGDASLKLWGEAYGFHRPSAELQISNNLFQNRQSGLNFLVDSRAANDLGYPGTTPPVAPSIDASGLDLMTNAFYGTETGHKLVNNGLNTLKADGNYWGISTGPIADWLAGEISATTWIATYRDLDKQTGPASWPQSVTESVEPGFWPLDPQGNKFSNPPVLQAIPAQTSYALEPFSYQVQATDADGDALSYAVLYAPAGLSIDSNGLITWTPTADQAMQGYAFFVQVCDASSCVQEPVSINVQMRPKAPGLKLFLPAINR